MNASEQIDSLVENIVQLGLQSCRVAFLRSFWSAWQPCENEKTEYPLQT